MVTTFHRFHHIVRKTIVRQEKLVISREDTENDWSTPAENPIGRVASATKSSNLRMMNFLTYPPPVPLRRAMKLAEDSINPLQAAKDELCKPKLRRLIKENDSTHFNELSKTISSIHKN